MRARAWIGVRGLLATGLVAAAAGLVPSAAMGDGPAVSFDHGVADSSGEVWLGSPNISAHIQDANQGDDSVQCSVDGNNPGPCGTRDSSCPVAQCWTYVFTQAQDGYSHDLEVDAGSQDSATLRYDNYFQVSLALPGDPRLSTPPFPGESSSATTASQRPEFSFDLPSSTRNSAPVKESQCAETPLGTGSINWVQCLSGHSLPGRLSLTGTYRFQVRVMDILGRVDPRPPQYVFSPTPCRPHLIGAPRSLAQFLAGGIRVRVQCVQPVGSGSFVDLAITDTEAQRLGLPGPVLASWYVHTSHTNQTVVVQLRGLAGVPRYAFGVHGLRADLVAIQRDSYGFSGRQRDVVRQ